MVPDCHVMPKGLKIFLIVFVSLVVLGGGCLYVGGIWLEGVFSNLKETGEKTQTEAKEWSKKHTQAEALNEAVKRGEECSGDLDLSCLIQQRLFLGFSLEAAKKTPGFCKSVPPTEEIMKSATWRVEQCRKLKADGSQKCPNVIAAVQDYCDKTREAKNK